MNHYDHNGSANPSYLRECVQMETEERPQIKWAGKRNVTIYVGENPQATTTYLHAREYIKPEVTA